MSLADTLVELINIPSVIGNEEEITSEEKTYQKAM